MHDEWQRDGFTLSLDKARLDVDVIHGFLRESYWAAGIPREVVERAIEGSLCLGLYHQGQQVGFARAVTDGATFAYVADVFILPAFRGRSLARWMMETLTGLPRLQGLRRWMLVTRDMQPLYAQVGFTPISNPERFMQRWDPDVYRRAKD